MKKIIPYIPFIILLIISIVSLSFSESKRNEQTCTAIKFNFNTGKLSQEFITDKEIFKSIKISKNDILGKKTKNIQVHKIEEAIENIPSVLACECYFKIDGTLQIDIQQRIPVVRIIGLHDSYYIDQYGRLMPLSKNLSTRTIIASGNILDGFRKKHNVMLETAKDSSDLQALYLIAIAINKDTFLNSLIEQIYVNNINDYILISKVGPTFIEFGKIENYEEKLINIKSFYKSEKVRENWHLYETISVKYRNQIVCTKI